MMMNDSQTVQPHNEHPNHESFSPDPDSDVDTGTLRPNEIVGDPLLPKPPDILRIMFQNVNSISVK